MYTGPVEPGSTHDLTAARLHVLPALYRSAWLGMPVLADKGYQGAGIGVVTPTKNPCPTPDEQTRNNLLSAMRAPAERANAMKLIQGVVLKTWSESAAVMVCSNVCRGRR